MRLCIDGKEHNLTMKVDSWNDVEIQTYEAGGGKNWESDF